MFLSKRRPTIPECDIRTPEGFTCFYNTNLDLVLNICFKYTRDATLSEDIAAKLFARLWEIREELHSQNLDQTSWKYYLVTSAKHRVFDHFKSVKTKETHLVEIAKMGHSADSSTESEIYLNELTEQVNHYVDQLPPKCKQVFQLSRTEGLSNKEIAQYLSVSDNTVKTHIANALSYLRKNLGDYALPKRSYGV